MTGFLTVNPSEVLLGSITPFELMMGKLLGMVGVSLTTVSLYLGGAYWAAQRYGFAEYLPAWLIGWFLLYQTLGILMYGSLFIAIGAASVRIAEGPGHRRNTLDLADAAGYFRIVPRFEEIFTDLNIDDVSQIHIPRQVSRMGKLYLPNTALRADLLVSIPKMKTHHWAAATLSMKNLFGTVPGALYGWPKNMLHWAGIDESIADL